MVLFHYWQHIWELIWAGSTHDQDNGSCAPPGIGSTSQLQPDHNHVLMLFFHCFSWMMSGWGHIPGALPPYTVQHLLDNQKLLNIVGNETWGTLNFSPPLKSIHLWQVSKSLLHQQIDKGHWDNSKIVQDMEQLAYLFITLLTQTGTEHHYRVALIWCHPPNPRSTSTLCLRNWRTMIWVMDYSQCWCRYSVMPPSEFSQIHPSQGWQYTMILSGQSAWHHSAS